MARRRSGSLRCGTALRAMSPVSRMVTVQHGSDAAGSSPASLCCSRQSLPPAPGLALPRSLDRRVQSVVSQTPPSKQCGAGSRVCRPRLPLSATIGATSHQSPWTKVCNRLQPIGIAGAEQVEVVHGARQRVLDGIGINILLEGHPGGCGRGRGAQVAAVGNMMLMTTLARRAGRSPGAFLACCLTVGSGHSMEGEAC